ncbi:hypothetical protein D4A47_12820 [Anaerotruncus massiliensis (ex Liu et al. 2021)]|uniref:Uncharacterized protein n=2 Tax=Anaerotruncus TaxID=244127 RepID=A0A498CSB7_9FIRM|nr:MULTISPECIES: hypothetical protein [Anaerotruncus]MBC3939816.1 hypothetical protein [Anaerotruncus massiliensis (ex Togo et al. 2019)]RLL07991.1 hypothetical protein D4A47_12820 [Anaerotruncus massiliensis (ex Liu et al. 2021)]
MANKFTKSVLERQAKEMRQHPARAAKPAGGGETPAQEAAAAPAAQEAPQAAPAAIPAEQPEAAAAPAPKAAETPAEQPAPRARAARQPRPAAQPVDLTEFIVRDEGRMAKNKTFYLDAAVIDALHRAAVAQKVTDSKLVNDILRKILGL